MRAASTQSAVLARCILTGRSTACLHSLMSVVATQDAGVARSLTKADIPISLLVNEDQRFSTSRHVLCRCYPARLALRCALGRNHSRFVAFYCDAQPLALAR